MDNQERQQKIMQSLVSAGYSHKDIDANAFRTGGFNEMQTTCDNPKSWQRIAMRSGFVVFRANVSGKITDIYFVTQHDLSCAPLLAGFVSQISIRPAIQNAPDELIQKVLQMGYRFQEMLIESNFIKTQRYRVPGILSHVVILPKNGGRNIYAVEKLYNGSSSAFPILEQFEPKSEPETIPESSDMKSALVFVNPEHNMQNLDGKAEVHVVQTPELLAIYLESCPSFIRWI